METLEAESGAPKSAAEPASPSSSDAPAKKEGNERVILRNTMYLGLAEILSMPLSVLLNVMMGRYLGPEDIGHIYLAGTIAGLAFMIISWGHHGSLPANVVLDKPNAGTYLGTSLAWRSAIAVLGFLVITAACQILGVSSQQQWAIGLVFMSSYLTTLTSTCQDVAGGFERLDISAYVRVGVQFFSMALVIVVLLLGGGMRLTLLMQSVSVGVTLIFTLRMMKKIGIGRLGFDAARLKKLLVGGTPFVFFGLVLTLQPNIDAFYLADLSSAEVVGWYSVARRLLGVLLVPATAMIGALYPTLCRLFVQDIEGFQRTARNALSTVSLLVVPVALGCALYPDIGVSLFGPEFKSAEDTVRLSSLYLFLVYFSMPLGTAIVASGRQRAWTITQCLCVVTSLLLDPFLIRHFQASHANGGIGLALATTVNELLMVGIGIWLLPRGVLNGVLAKTIGLSVFSGSAMVGTALGLRFLPSLVAAPVAVAAYGVVLYFSGAISPEQLASLTGFIRRKLGRRAVAG